MKPEKTALYDLNNSYFLYEDIEFILSLISDLYDIQFLKDKTIYTSKTKVSAENHWMSNQSTITFNKIIPKIKALTKDMYSAIENIFKAKHGEFEKFELEKKYKFLKELRVLNNKFKHYDIRSVEINVTEMVLIGEVEHTIECMVNFKYLKPDLLEVLRFSDLVNIFMSILEEEKIIEIDRNNEMPTMAHT